MRNGNCHWVQLKIKAARDGAAKFRLVLRRGQQRGNNYRVKLFHLHGSQKGQMIAESGDIVAWDRAYLEIDHMRRGTILREDTSAFTDTIAVDYSMWIHENDLINISDDDNYDGDYRIVTGLAGQGAVTLGAQLGSRIYHTSRHGAVTYPQVVGDGYVFKEYTEVDRSWVGTAFGNIREHPTGDDCGCFVEFVPVRKSMNMHSSLRYRDVLLRNDCNGFLDACFDNKAQPNVIHVAYIDHGQFTGLSSGLFGLTDSDARWSYVCLGCAESETQVPGQPINFIGPSPGSMQKAGQALAHELMHQFDYRGLLSYGPVDGDHPDTPEYRALNDPSHYCVMAYGGDTNTAQYTFGADYCTFCRPCLRQIRYCPWP